jgi:tetratricopeptide (TPR) repeat protein
VDAHRIRGDGYRHKEKWSDAIADYTRVIELNPKDTSPRFPKANKVILYINRADAYCSLSIFDKAIADCGEAIRLDPQSSDAFTERATAHYLAQHYDLALADTNEAIRLAPKATSAYLIRSAVFFKKMNYVRAFIDTTEVIKLDPQCDIAYANRARIYQAMEKPDEAIADCTRYIQMASRGPTMMEMYAVRAYARQSQGKLNEAIADLTKSIDMAPFCGQLYYDRGRIYKLQGEKAKAERDFDKAKELGFREQE